MITGHELAAEIALRGYTVADRPPPERTHTRAELYTMRLQAASLLELADLERSIAEMREQGRMVDVLDQLALGPHARRFDCRVCTAFGPWMKEAANWDTPPYDVFIYHEVPKLGMTLERELHYGPGADEIYRRCIDTYRAAGWRGEATAPNATSRREL